MIFFIIGTKCTKTNKQTNKENMLETVKEELLNSLKEIEGKDECQLGKMAAHIKNPKETAGIIR